LSKPELIASLKWKIEKWRTLHEQNPNDTYLILITQAQQELKKLNASQN
jgi:hypothetical protein